MSFTEEWVTGPEQTKFYTRAYSAQAPKAAIVFLHGFVEHVGRYEHVFPLWVARNISVLAFDQRGFGRTALNDFDGKKFGDTRDYAVTSWPQQFCDVEFFLEHAKKKWEGVPLFLVGHSMGAAIALAFVTRTSAPPRKESVSLLKGVIASSPLLRQAIPAPKWKRWAGAKISGIAPGIVVPSTVIPETLSHDSAVNEAYMKDPLVKQFGRVRGLDHMLSGGESLTTDGYKHWPVDLPVLLIHGDDDKVTSFVATKDFSEKLPAKDKKFVPFEGGYHELHNEPNGVKEKVIEEYISWAEAHINAVAAKL